MKHHFLKITLNFSAVVLLLALIATPFYFAKNVSRIAGVKSASTFLLVSQVEKFPGLSFSQKEDRYQVTFEKLGPSQAYLGVLILNNPTESSQKYQLLVKDGSSKVFFGEDLENPLTQITLPASASVPISLLSEDNASSAEIVEFTIQTN